MKATLLLGLCLVLSSAFIALTPGAEALQCRHSLLWETVVECTHGAFTILSIDGDCIAAGEPCA